MTDWTEDAACTTWPPELWFAEGTSDHATADRALARHICATCPVTTQCLDLALTAETGSRHFRWGIYAGTTPRERARIAREGAA